MAVTQEQIKTAFNNLINKIGNNFSFLAEKKANAELDNLTETAEKHFLNKKQVTNCILEAPHGVLEVINNGKAVKVPKGLKVIFGDGKNSDLSLNGFEYTVQNEIIAELSETIDRRHVFFLSVDKDKNKCNIDYRTISSQYFEQAEMPTISVNECTWLNTDANIWYNISEVTKKWEKVYRVKLGYADITNGVITEIKTFQPLRMITYSDRLTDINEPDYTKGETVTYNTVYTAPEDGEIFVATSIGVSSNVFDGQDRNKYTEIWGIIGKKVSVQKTETGGELTKEISYEYPIAGTYNIEIPTNGYYKVWLVGGGGNGISQLNMYSVAANAGGGSGAGFIGELYLNAGRHTVVVGSGGQATTIDGITAGAGGNAAFTNLVNSTAGAGGAISITGQIRNVELQVNGNSGNAGIGAHTPGGASVYGGYGTGGASNSSPTGGYFKLYGMYQESTLSNEINVQGASCYRHRQSVVWDGDGNTVSAGGINSAVIPIHKGNQFMLFTYWANASQISSEIIFYPYKYNTSVNM